MKYLIIALGATAATISSAQAEQLPKCKKTEPRVCEFTYDPNDIYKAWSAPGSELMIRLAPDEQIINAQGADSTTIVGGYADNILTLKFNGCALPEPVFVVSHKVSTDETRTYPFEVETIPQTCNKDIPPADQNIAKAQYTDGVGNNSLPNLKHLAHPNDLAAGGTIPYLMTMRYPSDEKAKRDHEARREAARAQKAQAEQILADAAAGRGPTTQFLNDHYYGRGEQSLRPAQATDDGNTTTLAFPGNTEVPALTKLNNAANGCGDKGEESTADFAMHGDKMVIAGTAPGWCLRKNGRVYELHNASFNPVGYPTGTGTVSPFVTRSVKGGSEQ